MSGLVVLIGAAMGMGALALAGFFWAMRAGQYEDIEGAAQRILIDDDRPQNGLTRVKAEPSDAD